MIDLKGKTLAHAQGILHVSRNRLEQVMFFLCWSVRLAFKTELG